MSTPIAELAFPWKPYQGKFYQLELPDYFYQERTDLFSAGDMGLNIAKQATYGLSLNGYIEIRKQGLPNFSKPVTVSEDVLGGHNALTLRYPLPKPSHYDIAGGIENITVTATQLGEEFVYVLFYEDARNALENQQIRERIISSITFR